MVTKINRGGEDSAQCRDPVEDFPNAVKMVLIERHVASKPGADSVKSDDSTDVESSQTRSSGMNAKSCSKSASINNKPTLDAAVTKTMSVVSTTSGGDTSIMFVPVAHIDQMRLKAFELMLEGRGINVHNWGQHMQSGTKSIEQLFWEAYQQKACIITNAHGGTLKRVVRIVKVKILAKVCGFDHVLISRLQCSHEGNPVERQQYPLKKLIWNTDSVGDRDVEDNEAVYAETCSYTEDWREGCKEALRLRLGLPASWQDKHLQEDRALYNYRIEDDIQSKGYPGLNTLYCIHEVAFRVKSMTAREVRCIGLPDGIEFATAEGDLTWGLDLDTPIGAQLNIWTWMDVRSSSSLVLQASQRQERAASGELVRSDIKQSSLQFVPAAIQQGVRLKRVPLTSSSLAAVRCLRRGTPAGSRTSEELCPQEPNPLFVSVVAGQKTDWASAKKMVTNMAKASYSLEKFSNDIQIFPELALYLIEMDALEQGKSGDKTNFFQLSSGRTIGDEYQRTMGAFFAIYWMLRLSSDGKDGFCFGVDSDWKVITAKAAHDKVLNEAPKRSKFFDQVKWEFFDQLLRDAELVVKKGRNWVPNPTRIISLLALTAVHDIMKMVMLLPNVQEQHAPYHGYAAGDQIGDHDVALMYLMDFYPKLLPSFEGLEKHEKTSLQFTQCQLCFNHGWFVQAEAPPGATLTKFKEALVRKDVKVKTKDVALYFVHWLTDLAGAEPTPLGGCEKFVLKFPLPVLNSFLRSFQYVQKIATRTETEVMEEYFKIRWDEHEPRLGPHPRGPSGVAKMRLLCMSQANSVKILDNYHHIPKADQELLNEEMSRTGCTGQRFSPDIAPPDAHKMGPSLLIYYGPAFLQALGTDSPITRLQILAEIYRGGRSLWPLCAEETNEYKIVRVDAIKGLSVPDLMDVIEGGSSWVLSKRNENECFAEIMSRETLNKNLLNGDQFQILDIEDIVRKTRVGV